MRTLKQQQAKAERERNRKHDLDVARAHMQRIAREDARMPDPIRAVLSQMQSGGATPRQREEW